MRLIFDHEKGINWCKVIHHIFFLKHKALELQIVYRGWHKWYLTGRWERKCCHASIGIEGEIWGLWFNFNIYDYRHWNNMEKRFYLDEEPEVGWIGHNYSRAQYWADIERTIKAHPELDDGYYDRCKKAYKEHKQERRKMAALFKKWEAEENKPFVFKRKIDWGGVVKGVDWEKHTYKIKELAADEVEVRGFRRAEVCSKEAVVPWLDLYDKQGNLCSSLRDYHEE